MAASSSLSATIMPESVCEGVDELFEANNNILLMALMEETQEDEYCEEDVGLMDMIQPLEAEISSGCCSCSPAPYDFEVGQVDGQDFSTSSISCWEDDIEVGSASGSSSSSFDEDMMDAWNLCAAGGDDRTDDYYYYDSSEFYYEVLLDNYLPSQEASIM